MKHIIILLSIAIRTGTDLIFLLTDYLEGFPENPIEDFKPSFNTTVNYTHYKLDIPKRQGKH